MSSRSGPDSDVAERIARAAERVGVALGPEGLDLAQAYIGLLTKWNRKVNLTALPLEPLADEAIERLLLEPAIAAGHVLASDRAAIDVGSGGGSPAIPLKIAAPWLRVTLVESRSRKASFLREAIRELGLTDVTVENIRFEELAQRRETNPANLVSLRAVRADSALWPIVWSLLAPGGRAFWFRSAANQSGAPRATAGSPGAAEVERAVSLLNPARVERHVLIPQRNSELVILSKPG